MTSITISIHTVSATTPNPPTGYGVFRVRNYPIHGYGVDLDAAQRQADMWAVVPVWVEETDTWSAVKGNYAVIGFSDITNLFALQPVDGHTLAEKMGWLVHSATANDPQGWGVAPMWTGNSKSWSIAQEYYVGSQLWAGQLCACSLATFPVNIKGTLVLCRKVLPFQKSDWQRQADWLYPYVTIAHKDNNRMTDYVYDRGQIRVMQQVLNPSDYPFSNGVVPSAFYVPIDWVSQL